MPVDIKIILQPIWLLDCRQWHVYDVYGRHRLIHCLYTANERGRVLVLASNNFISAVFSDPTTP